MGADATVLSLFWQHKSPQDNQWHPLPGENPNQIFPHAPSWFRRTDLEATVVDTAPFIAGAGGLAHIRQLPHFGFTAHWSVFKNAATMTAMHRTTVVLTPLLLACQAVGVEYRYYIPRWAHERERRRDEEYVRTQIGYGMLAGASLWTLRMLLLRVGRRYWAPMDIVMGGALADLMDREYRKAHGF